MFPSMYKFIFNANISPVTWLLNVFFMPCNRPIVQVARQCHVPPDGGSTHVAATHKGAPLFFPITGKCLPILYRNADAISPSFNIFWSRAHSHQHSPPWCAKHMFYWMLVHSITCIVIVPPIHSNGLPNKPQWNINCSWSICGSTAHCLFVHRCPATQVTWEGEFWCHSECNDVNGSLMEI